MAMQTLTISVPPDMRAYIDNRTQTGGFGNTSEFVRDLIRREREQRAQDALEAQLINNLNSPLIELTPDARERLIVAVEARIANRGRR